MQLDQVALDSKSLFSFAVSFTPAATAAASAVVQNVTVPDGTPALKSGDMILVNGPAPGNNTGILNARYVNATTIGLVIINPTAGSLTHAAGTFNFLVIRH